MDVLDLMNDTNHVGPGYDPSQRPFICSYANCRKSFSRKSDLGRHSRIHTGDRPYACPYHDCGKTFIQNSALTVHIRTHTGEKPHHCETCEKAFADSSSLARHRRIHTGKRPYTCMEKGCGRSFARRNTFLKHFRSQHPHLPAPSTNTARHTVHYPVTSGRKFLGALAATSSDPNFMISAPSASPHSPHGFAALPRPRGAAYSFTGGIDRLSRAALPYGSYALRGRGSESNRDGGSGPRVGGGRVQHQFSSVPASETSSQQSQSQCHSQRSTSGVPSIHTPVSATSSFYENSISAYPSPINALSPESSLGLKSADHSPAHLGGPGDYDSRQGGATDEGVQDHLGPSPYHAHAVYRSVSVGSLPPPPPGMMWFKSDVHARTPSTSATPRSLSSGYKSAPFGNLGGFSVNQLALPPAPPTHLLPPFFATSTHPHPPHSEPFTVPPHTMPVEEPMRPSSPELVDIATMPSFTLHAPPQSLSMGPHSAIEPGHNSLFATHQVHYTSSPSHSSNMQVSHGRLHSAPPFLTRFHSSPLVPTLPSQSGWDKWDNASPFQGHAQANEAQTPVNTSVNASVSTSANGTATSGNEEEWKRMEDEILSRDITLAPDEALHAHLPAHVPHTTSSAPAPTPMPTSAKSFSSSGDQWGSPIAFPGPPREPARVFSMESAVSDALNVPSSPKYTVHTVPSQTFQPLQGGLAQLQGYVTPWSTPLYDMDQKPQEPTNFQPCMVVQTPVSASPRQSAPGSYFPLVAQPTDGHVHDITLASPPLRRDTVATVGLGISNVHFHDCSNAIQTEQRPQHVYVADSKIEVHGKGGTRDKAKDVKDTPESDGLGEELDDGSDDEFIPGRSRKKKQGGVKKRARGSTVKARRR